MSYFIRLTCSLSLLLVSSLNQISSQSITIDMSTEHQTIRGFGGMNHTTWIRDLNEDNREKAFGNNPGELGLSILRIHLDPNSAQFSLEIPTALHAIQKNAIVFATPWNAPNSVLDPNAAESKVDPAKYGEYVTHLNSFNTFMSNNGAPLYAISVQNEPDYGDWTRWTSGEMVDFMSNYAQDIENRVMAPESFQFRRDFTDPILNDSAANAHLDIVGGHIYGGGLADYPLARSKGKEVWMTEHYTESSHSANDWPLALDVATEISNCMKANFNAYVWWYIRRFYGLIDDAGNITKRGYIMSQFSKFIRPGALRVEGTVSSAPNVDVTAYKTDSSLVIVVVNRGSTNVNLAFTIQNGSIDTLTKFTTSATKNMVNDGGISISGGTFNTTVDASSITTIASYTANAGKNANIKPVAVAGDDLILIDNDGNGSETTLLDGSGSSDDDGEIINYSWSLNGTQLAWEPTYELTAEIGEHELVLTVTDNDGSTHSDTLNITVNSLSNTNIWFEAECGLVGSNWQISGNASASNGKFVMAPAGTQSIAAASTDTADHIVFTFHVPETGIYKLWGRVITPTANDDSYWIKMDDDTTWAMWNSIPAGSSWHWENVFDQNNGSAVETYSLDTGYHALSICYREDGAQLDKLLLTNTGLIPSDMGDDATNCPEDSIPQVSNVNYKGNFTVSIYPNPAHSEIQVYSKTAFKSLEILSITGESVVQKSYGSSINETSLLFDLSPGVYILKLCDEYKTGIQKLIIE